MPRWGTVAVWIAICLFFGMGGAQAGDSAQTEQQRLIEQLKRLVDAIETNGNVAAETARARELLAATESTAQGAAATNAVPADRARPTLQSARVLDVNPQLRVAVVNVGAEQGARVGMPMIVMRGNRAVAWLTVVEVRRQICGATIDRVAKGLAVTAGDTARVTKN